MLFINFTNVSSRKVEGVHTAGMALKLYASVAKGLKLKKTKNVLAAISDVSRSYSGRTGREGPNSSIQLFNMGKAFC